MPSGEQSTEDLGRIQEGTAVVGTDAGLQVCLHRTRLESVHGDSEVPRTVLAVFGRLVIQIKQQQSMIQDVPDQGGQVFGHPLSLRVVLRAQVVIDRKSIEMACHLIGRRVVLPVIIVTVDVVLDQVPVGQACLGCEDLAFIVADEGTRHEAASKAGIDKILSGDVNLHGHVRDGLSRGLVVTLVSGGGVSVA